jgi:hypothetical protein
MHCSSPPLPSFLSPLLICQQITPQLRHALQLATTPQLPFSSTYMSTDNTPTQAWVSSGSTSTDKAPALLLRELAHHCHDRNAALCLYYTPGSTNTLADFLSRSFALSDADLLQQLQQKFSVQPPWKLVTPPTVLLSSMNLALSRQ